MQPYLQPIVDTFGVEALRTLFMDWAPRLLGGVFAIVLFAVLAFVVRRVLASVFKRVKLDPTAAGFVQSVTLLAFITVGTLTALSQFGVDTTSLLTSVGVLGLTVGFAAQNTLSNVISGLFIFWDRPFVIGDLVEVDGEYGRIETITLRSTRLVTVDGRMVAIPNAVIANGRVASYTNFPNLRIDVPVTIGVNESIGRAREILLGLVTDPAVWMAEPAPAVVVKDLGDYNVTIELRAWLIDETKHVAARFALREAIKEAFDRAGVEMPFETLALTPVKVEPVEVREAPAA